MFKPHVEVFKFFIDMLVHSSDLVKFFLPIHACIIFVLLPVSYVLLQPCSEFKFTNAFDTLFDLQASPLMLLVYQSAHTPQLCCVIR